MCCIKNCIKTNLSLVAVNQEWVIALIKNELQNSHNCLLRGVHIGILVRDNMDLIVINPIFLNELKILRRVIFIDEGTDRESAYERCVMENAED